MFICSITENVKNAMEKVIEKYWEFGIEKKMAFGRSRQWTLNGSVWDNNYYGRFSGKLGWFPEEKKPTVI